MLTTKFGVGNSEFRTGGSGYVDTVPFGAFKREIFEKVGMFNTTLLRSEDNEMKIFLLNIIVEIQLQVY